MKKIYKSIIIRIFKIIHGEINSIYKSKNFEKISLIKNKKKYVIYQIPKCRIYTDTIHDTAFLYKNPGYFKKGDQNSLFHCNTQCPEKLHL